MEMLVSIFIMVILLSAFNIQFTLLVKASVVNYGVYYLNIVFLISAILSYVYLNPLYFILIVCFTFGISAFKLLCVMVSQMSKMLKSDNFTTQTCFRFIWIPMLFQTSITFYSFALYLNYITLPKF